METEINSEDSEDEHGGRKLRCDARPDWKEGISITYTCVAVNDQADPRNTDVQAASHSWRT